MTCAPTSCCYVLPHLPLDRFEPVLVSGEGRGNPPQILVPSQNVFIITCAYGLTFQSPCSLQVCSQQWCQLLAAVIGRQEVGVQGLLQVMLDGDDGRNRHSRHWSSCQMVTASALQLGKTLLLALQHPAVMPYLGLPVQLCQTHRQLCHILSVTAILSQKTPLPVHKHSSMWQRFLLSQRCLTQALLLQDNSEQADP